MSKTVTKAATRRRTRKENRMIPRFRQWRERLDILFVTDLDTQRDEPAPGAGPELEVGLDAAADRGGKGKE